MSKKRSFQYNGETLDVEEQDVLDFIKAAPEAKEVKSYILDGDTVDVALPDVKEFEATAKNAKPLYGEEPKQTDPYAPKPVTFGTTTSVSPIIPEKPKQRDFTQLKALQVQNEKWTNEKKVMAAHIDNMKESLDYTNPNQQSMFGETTGNNKAEVASYVESLDQMTTSVKENNDKQIAILTKVFDKDIKPNYKQFVGRAGYGGIEVPNAGMVQEYTDNLMKEMGVDNADDNKRDFIKNAANQYISSLNTYEKITPEAEKIFEKNTGKSMKTAMDEEQKKLYAPIIEIDKQYEAQSKMLPKIVDAQYQDEMAQIGKDAEHLNQQIKNEAAQVDQHFAEMGKKLQAASVNMNQQQYDAALNILNQQYKEAQAEKFDNYTMAFGAVVAQEAKINNQRKTDYAKQNQLNYNAYLAKRNAEMAKLSKDKGYSKEFQQQYEKAFNEAYAQHNKNIVDQLNKNQEKDNVPHVVAISAMKSMSTSLNNLAKSIGLRGLSDSLEKVESGIQMSPKQMGDALDDPNTFKNSTGLLDDIKINLKVTATDLFSKTGAATAGQIAGSGALGMAMAAGSAYMGNALGVSEGLTMAVGGLVSWAQETHDIKKGIYNQVYANTNDVQLAEQAADIGFDSQLFIMGLNMVQMAKFMPDAELLTNMVKNPILRRGAIIGAEQVSNTLEEYYQNAFENSVTDPLRAYQQKTFTDAGDYFTAKLFKQTALQTLPMMGQSAVITFASGAGKGLSGIQKYRADKLQQMRADALLSSQIAQMGDNFGAQQLTQFYDVQGGAATITSITQLQAKGKITAEKATELVGALLNHDRHNIEAKKLSLQGSNLYAYTGLRQKQDELERDLLSAATEEEKATLNAKKGFIQGLITELTTKGTADIVLFRYKNGVQLTMTQAEATKLLMEEGAAQHIQDAGIEVIAMGKTEKPIQDIVSQIVANQSEKAAATTSDKKDIIALNEEHKQLAFDLLNRQKELLNEGIYDFSKDEKWNEINDGLKKIEQSIADNSTSDNNVTQTKNVEIKTGNKIQWDVFGNEDSGEWTVGEKTKTRGGQDAFVLSKVYIKASSDGKSYTKEYADANGIKYDNERTVEHIVSLEDLQSPKETTKSTSDNKPQTAEERAAAVLARVKRAPQTEKQKLEEELKTATDQEVRTNIGQQITLHETKAQHEQKLKDIDNNIANLSENGKVVENLAKINALAAEKTKTEESISDIDKQLKTKQNERETKAQKGRKKDVLNKGWHDLEEADRITVGGVGAKVDGVNKNLNGSVFSINYTMDDGTKGEARISGQDIVDENGKAVLLKMDNVIQSEKAAPQAETKPTEVKDKGVGSGVGGDVKKYSEPKRYNSEIEVGQKYYDNRYGDSYVIEKMTPVEGGDVDVALKYDKGKTRTESGNFLLYHIDAKQHSLSKEQPIVAETPNQEKTNDYYIYDFDNKEFVKTENAKPVKLDTDGDFFAVKGDNGYYTIYEGTSGQGIGQSGKLLRDAIKNANESIERNNKAGFPLDMAISGGIKRNGQSPRVKAVEQSLSTQAQTTSDSNVILSENKGEGASDNIIQSESPTKRYEELIKAIDNLKKEYPKEFKKDGTPKSNSKILPSYKAMVDMAAQAYEDSYLERQAQRRKEAKVIADKKDTGIVDGMANIASNSNAAQLFKSAMSKGIFNESDYNQIGTELALLPKDENGQVDVGSVAEIISSYIDNVVRPEKNDAQKKETEAINKAFEERQSQLAKNLTSEEIQDNKEFDEINRIFNKVQNDETPTKKEIDYINQNAWLPKGFVFGKNGLQEGDGFDKAADATIEALNKLKIIDTKSTDKRMGMDGEKIIRAAFDASRVIYHASKSLAEAIKKALQTVRDSDWYKNLSGDQKSDIDNLVRAQLNAYAKENVVAEPLPELDWDMQDQDVKEQIIINAQNLIESEEFKDYKEFSLRLKELYGLKESDAKTIYDSLVEHINVQTEDPFSIALRGKGAVTDHMNNKTLNESSEDEIGNRTYLANSFAEMNEDIDAVFNRIRAANPKNWEKIIADKILERLDAREMQAAIFADRFVTFINNYLADHQRSPNYTEKAREYKKYRIEILRRRQKFTQEFATYFAKLQQLKLHNPLTMLTEQGLLDANQMKAAKEMDEQLKGKKEYDASGKPKPFVEDSKLDKAPPTSDKKEKETKKASKAEVKKNVLNALKNAKDNAADLAIKITKIPC